LENYIQKELNNLIKKKNKIKNNRQFR